MKTLNNHKLNGFTLLEFILAVLVVATLSAIIIPKFTYLKTHTIEHTIKIVAQNLNEASASNYHLSKIGSRAVTISNCKDIKNLLSSDRALPNNCSIVSSPITTEHKECTVRCLYDNGALTITEIFIGYKVP